MKVRFKRRSSNDQDDVHSETQGWPWLDLIIPRAGPKSAWSMWTNPPNSPLVYKLCNVRWGKSWCIGCALQLPLLHQFELLALIMFKPKSERLVLLMATALDGLADWLIFFRKINRNAVVSISRGEESNQYRPKTKGKKNYTRLCLDKREVLVISSRSLWQRQSAFLRWLWSTIWEKSKS